MPPVNLLVDLADEIFAQNAVHHEIEALDRTRNVYVSREHRTPEPILSWIDAEFGGVWSSEAAAGGIWIAQKAGEPLGFAAFDARGLGFHWLRAWAEKHSVGVFGPFGVISGERRGGIGTVLLHASLYSLRERGYRQALIPAVGGASLIAYYEQQAHARVAEVFEPDRRGKRFRATVLASGYGSNFQNVIDDAARGDLPLEVTALIVNKPRAYVLERAAAAHVPAHLVTWDRAQEAREAYDARVLATVAATEPELVLLLGWTHVLPAAFVARFPDTLNLHPAFLPLDPALDAVTMPDGTVVPAYRGAHAFDDALTARSGWSGASVHRLCTAVDRGAVYARAPFAFAGDCPRDELAAYLHETERTVVRAAIRRWGWEQP